MFNLYTLGIQSYSQIMIGMFNHLLSEVFRFHYRSQKVIGSLGTWYARWFKVANLLPERWKSRFHHLKKVTKNRQVHKFFGWHSQIWTGHHLFFKTGIGNLTLPAEDFLIFFWFLVTLRNRLSVYKYLAILQLCLFGIVGENATL